jgi:hypothetical protein
VTGRVGVQAKYVSPSLHRPTVPVTVTNTTNTYIPETNITNESTQTYDVDIDAERSACVGSYGNVWADKTYAMPDGVPASQALAAAEVPEDNMCYTLVSMKSSEIRDMGRFFPPRYFPTGRSLTCGVWLDGSAVDDAILDAKKGSRVGWTIAASIGGAALGVTGAEVVGHTLAKDTFMQGQKALQRNDEKAFLESKLGEKKDDEKDDIIAYVKAMQELQKLCDEDKSEQKNEHCTNGDLKRDVAGINLSKYGAANAQ